MSRDRAPTALRIRHTLVWIIVLSCLAESALLRAAEEKSSPEPTLRSIFPLSGQRGTVLEAEILGLELKGANALWSDADGISGEITTVEPIPAEKKDEKKKDQPTFRVGVQLKISATQLSGSYSLRLITARGISSPLRFDVNGESTVRERTSPHQTALEAEPVKFPVIINGRIAGSGELDCYAFEVSSGQQLLIEVMSGGLKAATGLGIPPPFQPQLNLYDTEGSWLDSQQSKWLASGSPDAPLIYRFERGGRYVLQVGTILGKGDPTYVYELRIVPTVVGTPVEGRQLSQGSQPEILQNNARGPGWQERAFTRHLTPVWIEVLHLRTVEGHQAEEPASDVIDKAGPSTQTPATQGSVGSSAYLAIGPSVKEIKEMEPNDTQREASTVPIPALISGAIDHPGDVDTFRFRVKAGERLAFEIESPEAAPPRFNPRLALLDAQGNEIVDNLRKRIYALRREAPSMTVPAFLDGIQPKVIATFAGAGDYYLKVDGLTACKGDSHCSYHVMVRDQVAHIGNATLTEDHVNLSQGESKPLNVTVDLEEGFDGELALTVDNLPEGVRAFPGAQSATVVPDGYETNHKENLDPQTRKVILVLSAEERAPTTQSARLIRVKGRPIVKGKMGREFTIAEIPLMVVKPLEMKSSPVVAATRVP